ncbi:hypothetical protein [Kozakia baliensis]|uniref:Uncharacterized protein n=1 Tax=Kozakia baliensis TaxID=153496 RepID=A0A1D8UV11_9PROT|nr:hypothetical protein [Kozakia baliensis]AOX17482.1 hypothetical protein A0U89_10405 [Kozakia baliensis]GBR30677.1 hypothetical protein AA0488_2066 [Kozakia baliensis NRIC 0488]GEL63055.1 hypothetical protein KBA01_03410 [Kozakia baliensis]
MSSAPLTSPSPPVSRGLMAVVIGMGVLIVIGTVVLLGVIVHRLSHPASHAATPLASAVSNTSLPVSPGSRLVGATARADGTLAVILARPEGDRLVIWNPATGQIGARLSLVP